MPVKFMFDNHHMSAWMLLHQTYNSLLKCEDAIFPSIGLTTQQHAILMAIKYNDSPATPTQIADWLDRNTNSISLIVNRMEKNGLVKRVRDVEDRRSLRIAMTPKGEEVLNNGVLVGRSLIREILGALSGEETKYLTDLLEKVRFQALKYCRKEKTLKEVKVRGYSTIAPDKPPG
jgi:MarR family transcriptional regulator, 2-MHQ and catechol-resistance regulon repressor